MTNVRAILLDIEGTTTPMTFVVGALFPYVRRHLRDYLREHSESTDLQSVIERFQVEWEIDRAKAAPAWVDTPPVARLESVAAYSLWLMDRDRKSTALKALQGLIWEDGYRRGELVGEVFDDVPGAFERWRARGLQIAIFSSGSVLAQQLLFRHSSAGDLSRYLRRHFDTTTGAKVDPESYRRIAAEMDTAPDAVLFVSDAIVELDAAAAAGMRTLLSIRPGNAPPSLEHEHSHVRSFDEVFETLRDANTTPR